MPKITEDDLSKMLDLLRSDPELYLAKHNEFVRENPQNHYGYFSRHYAWSQLGRQDLALADLNKSLTLSEHPLILFTRADVYREMGDYQKAIEDYDRIDSMYPIDFDDIWGPLYRADCHARLGNERAALADCARLKDDHWTPGPYDLPKGNKQQVIVEVRKRLAAARMK